MAEIEINLSENEHKVLREISLKTGKTENELIREAVGSFLKRSMPFKVSMAKARGIWKDRKDLPDFGRIRREWDRVQASVETMSPILLNRG